MRALDRDGEENEIDFSCVYAVVFSGGVGFKDIGGVDEGEDFEEGVEDGVY